MSRYALAEAQYASCVSAVAGLNRVMAASQAGKVVISQPPMFALFFNKKEHKKTLVATANSLKTLADLHFIGVLWVGSAGKDVDDARLVAYPLVDSIRAALAGFVPDLGSTYNSSESIGPTIPTNEEAIMTQVGYYAMMMEWKFEMSFSKGVA